MLPVSALNNLSLDEFAAALRPLFEAAPPLAAALHTRRPFSSYEQVIDIAEQLTNGMPLAEQIVVLAAHPRIGAKPETVSAASFREQGYAGEAAMDQQTLGNTYKQLEELNREYEERFGFRFVVFVNKRPKAEIVDVLRARLGNTRDQELRTGLRDMFLIARDRLCSQA